MSFPPVKSGAMRQGNRASAPSDWRDIEGTQPQSSSLGRPAYSVPDQLKNAGRAILYGRSGYEQGE
jgi:hypothetical protein